MKRIISTRATKSIAVGFAAFSMLASAGTAQAFSITSAPRPTVGWDGSGTICTNVRECNQLIADCIGGGGIFHEEGMPAPNGAPTGGICEI